MTLSRIIDALTCDEITVQAVGEWHDQTDKRPLLDRSIAWELRRIDATLGGSPVLRAIAHAIDEALLIAAEGL